MPIGRALPGYRILVLDEHLKEAADDVAGELYIGGAGLALGYWRNPQATNARFVQDPFLPGSRLYRSGDIVRRGADGVLEFVGRADDQTKLRGQRFEPAEVEAVLRASPGVDAAAVRIWEVDSTSDGLLVGYLVLAPGAQLSCVRGHLDACLPSYMLPRALVELPRFPLTSSGKVDRRALPRPSARIRAAVEPRDELESRLHAIWRDVLKIDSIGVHDNFFELGGHSLAAVHVIALIRDRLSVDVLLAAFLARPTISELALGIARGGRLGGKTRCLPLGDISGDRPQLFLVPPASGVGLVYLGLARELAGVATCTALQALGLDRSPPGSSSMEALVSRFADDVHRQQPAGTIRLLGYSAGGAIAQAMVHGLRKIGREVSHLILIDPYCAEDSALSGVAACADAEQGFWTQACPDVIWDALGLRGPAAEDVLRAARMLWDEGLCQPQWQPDGSPAQAVMRRAAELLPRSMDVGMLLLLLEGLANVWWAYLGQTMCALAHFGGQAWIVQPDGDDSAHRDRRLRQWRQWVPGLCQQIVRGEHGTMLSRTDTLSEVASHLRAALVCETLA